MMFCQIAVLVLGAMGMVRGTAEVMSHVTAHFGQALEKCREEVSGQFWIVLCVS